MEEYCLSVSKCQQEFDATYVIDWDCVCKRLLRGDVPMFQIFVVGSPRQDGNDAKDQCSDDELELGDGKEVTPSESPKAVDVKVPTPKPKAAHSESKTPGKPLGPFHQRVQQAKASAARRSASRMCLFKTYVLLLMVQFAVLNKERAAARCSHWNQYFDHIYARFEYKSALHCDFALFDVLGCAMYVEPFCLNLDVLVSTMYCRNALHTHM